MRVGQRGRTENLAGRVFGESHGLVSCERRNEALPNRKPKLLMAAVGGDGGSKASGRCADSEDGEKGCWGAV